MQKTYFAGLDAIRAYAFLLVFISHSYFSFFMVHDWATRWFAHGEVGVHMFFMLSAFLITYLSISEYSKTNSFSIMYFFKKRILRIWPVYAFVLCVSYALYYISNTTESMGCMSVYMYFFGNTCMISGIPFVPGSTTLAPMWSVSVEQQFYVVFPLMLVLYVWVSRVYKKSARVILHSILILTAIYSLGIRYYRAEDWNYISYAVIPSLFSFIAGMYLAYGLHMRAKYIIHVQKYARVYAISAIVTFFSFLYVKFIGHIGISLYLLPIIYATGIWIILSTASQDVKHPSSYTRIIRYLGKISYGLYAYHMFAMITVQYFFERTYPVFSSVLSLFITIYIAHISYRYFESFFLKFK